MAAAPERRECSLVIAEREILARRVDRPDAIAAAGLAEADLALAMSPGGKGGN